MQDLNEYDSNDDGDGEPMRYDDPVSANVDTRSAVGCEKSDSYRLEAEAMERCIDPNKGQYGDDEDPNVNGEDVNEDMYKHGDAREFAQTSRENDVEDGFIDVMQSKKTRLTVGMVDSDGGSGNEDFSRPTKQSLFSPVRFSELSVATITSQHCCSINRKQKRTAMMVEKLWYLSLSSCTTTLLIPHLRRSCPMTSGRVSPLAFTPAT